MGTPVYFDDQYHATIFLFSKKLVKENVDINISRLLYGIEGTVKLKIIRKC